MTHLSYWFKQALEMEQPTPPLSLQQDIATDVAIVGGGYTGLWTAIMIKQQSPEKQVVVIEKGLCGSGASGANGGLYADLVNKVSNIEALVW